ncbi:type II toxin-antitoxin system VapC family toxin [Candidatus Bathyarchaeota archaeon]|nr:MAG: type II toxin-antitoxin system VapC family toxin [Candidatus Bathyarchaeota archaeon]
MVEHGGYSHVERAPPTLVLDASVATKWFVEEEGTEKALGLRDAYLDGNVRLTAPDLLIYEVGNALNYNPKLSTTELVNSVQSLVEFDLELVPPSMDFITQTTKTARKYSLSAYDASYAALSELVATKLVTADRKLYEKLLPETRVYFLDDLNSKWDISP